MRTIQWERSPGESITFNVEQVVAVVVFGYERTGGYEYRMEVTSACGTEWSYEADNREHFDLFVDKWRDALEGRDG